VTVRRAGCVAGPWGHGLRIVSSWTGAAAGRTDLRSPRQAVAGDGAAQSRAAFRRLRHETLTAERQAVVALCDRGAISDEVLRINRRAAPMSTSWSLHINLRATAGEAR
jgi:hypothetical protein